MTDRQTPDSELVKLVEASSRFEAEVIVARLREAGIKSAYFADDGGGTHPPMINAEPIQIRVLASDRAAAIEAIGSSLPNETN